jgi:hypothetical protein
MQATLNDEFPSRKNPKAPKAVSEYRDDICECNHYRSDHILGKTTGKYYCKVCHVGSILGARHPFKARK